MVSEAFLYDLYNNVLHYEGVMDETITNHHSSLSLVTMRLWKSSTRVI